VLNEGNGWEWENGMINNSYCGSFPHDYLSGAKRREWMGMDGNGWLLG